MAHEISTFLSLLSDETFLSSIEYIDFRHRFVSVRRSYFNLLFKDIDIANPRGYARTIKAQYLSRFAEVSANKLKSYFLGLIRNSFLDFLNVHRYFNEVILRHLDSKEKKLIRRNTLRGHRYFERKAFKYYVFKTYHDNHDSETNSLTSVSDTLSRTDDIASNDENDVFTNQIGVNSPEPTFTNETQRILNEIQPYTDVRVLVGDLDNTYISNAELEDTITVRTYYDPVSNSILRQEAVDVIPGHELHYPSIDGEFVYSNLPSRIDDDDE